MPAKIQQLTELEQYELMVAAYPEKFAKREEEGEDDLWDEVMEYWEEVTNDPELVADLIARLAYLTMPMGSALTGIRRHVLGVPSLHNGSVNMTAAVTRDTEFNKITPTEKVNDEADPHKGNNAGR